MVSDDYKLSSLIKDSLKFYTSRRHWSDIYSVKNESAGAMNFKRRSSVANVNKTTSAFSYSAMNYFLFLLTAGNQMVCLDSQQESLIREYSIPAATHAIAVDKRPC